MVASFVGNNTSIQVSLTTGQSKVEDCDLGDHSVSENYIANSD